ncbi:hypothetical protein GCM10022247_43010 [Allokutzneria multivorans]|uniref:SH3 domain-containing protein n=2 Tax=Allokutzneria multivorans TaxID=1142134 RepID=A0ABP7SRG4_9PSEU
MIRVAAVVAAALSVSGVSVLTAAPASAAVTCDKPKHYAWAYATGDEVNVRKSPNSASAVTSYSKGHRFDVVFGYSYQGKFCVQYTSGPNVVGCAKDNYKSNTWFTVRYTYKKQKLTGYVHGSCLRFAFNEG